VFSARRVTEVRDLGGRIAGRQAALKAATDRAERARIRKDARQLAFLEASPPMTAGDMCPECPCLAWPQWRQKVERIREHILSMATRSAEPAPPPKPKPLAVIPSGLPIEEIIARLTALQETHPGGKVRRGDRNRWEIWPA
jgi:hypothetical protein